MFSNIVVGVATAYQKAVSLGELRKLNYSTRWGGFLLHSCYTLLLKARSLTWLTRIFSYIFHKFILDFFYILCTYMVRNVNFVLSVIIN